MDVLELAKKRDEIMAAQDIDCPECGDHQYSPFGKLFTKLAGRCQDCSTEEELGRLGGWVFQLIEA